MRWCSGAFETARQCEAPTKRQRTAAVQDAGARPVFRWLIAAALLLVLSGRLFAAPAAPEVNEVQPFVWQVDATNQVTLKGKELAGFRGLWTSRHGVLAESQLGATVADEGKELKLSVPVASAEAAGPFALRVITEGGVSAPVMAILENLLELQLNDGRLLGDEKGWYSGNVRTSAGERFHVHLEKGHPLVLELLAGRLGSKLDPVLRILDRHGKELKFVQDTPGAGVDCGLRFNAPAKGDYVIEIRDAQYGEGNDMKFHLRYGINPGGQSAPWVDSSENRESVGIYGVVLPEGLEDRLNLELANKPLATVVIKNPDFRHYLYDFLQLARANYRVAGFHSVSDQLPLERTLNDFVSVNSFLTKPDEVHRYTLKFDFPGPRRFTAMSRRLGGERDPVMRLKDSAGKTLKSSHLFQNEAVLGHEFKEAGNYELEVWDAAGQHGDFGGYHVRVERDPADFELNTETDSLRIAAGGEAELSVVIDRDGYDGPVKFELAHGPEGVELTDVVAKEKSKEAKFKVKLADSLTPGTTFPLKISGRGGEATDAPKTPLYTSAYWKKRFPDLYSPMFEFEDTVWVTVLPP